ncbi:MAG: cation transporter [Verrucomicrobiaceae bacterium]|nr:MAG: cation transporter [Verrucomicrobiaceae bacterium]
MPHDISLISMIAVGFALAFVLGYGASRLGLPPLVGYLLSGIVIGPHTPGFVADSHLAGQLAEIGVMLLMFGVGLHFSVSDLLAVRRIAIPGAIGQILIATAIGTGMAMMWGWSFGAGLILGLSLSVASTVVMLKALEERNAVASANGRIAVGWLIVEDLAMVLALVLIPAFAGALGGGAVGDAHGAPDRGLVVTVGVTLLEVAAFVAIALLVGPRVMPWLLRQAARTGSRELFTLATLAAALGIAFASAELFGVSFALGAFFAGVVLSESDLSHKAASNSLPLQDAFAVLFFVSVGMLFDPTVLIREPVRVLEVVGLILVGKSFVALGIVLALGYPVATGLVVSAALAQIGEFSFILAGLGITYRLLPQEGLNLILAGALISITLNPLAFVGADRACAWMRSHPRRKRWFDELGARKFAVLQKDLDASRERAAAAMAAHKTFTPEELVERFPLFAALTPEQREVLIVHFEPRSAQPGERIIRAGDKADAMYFISEGEVEICVAAKMFKLGAGDFFGEMALITGEQRSADVTALDYSRFATLSARDFRHFLHRFPDIRERIGQLAAERKEMNSATNP